MGRPLCSSFGAKSLLTFWAVVASGDALSLRSSVVLVDGLLVADGLALAVLAELARALGGAVALRAGLVVGVGLEETAAGVFVDAVVAVGLEALGLGVAAGFGVLVGFGLGVLVGVGLGVVAFPGATPGWRLPDGPCQAHATDPFLGMVSVSTPCWE